MPVPPASFLRRCPPPARPPTVTPHLVEQHQVVHLLLELSLGPFLRAGEGRGACDWWDGACCSPLGSPRRVVAVPRPLWQLPDALAAGHAPSSCPWSYWQPRGPSAPWSFAPWAPAITDGTLPGHTRPASSPPGALHAHPPAWQGHRRLAGPSSAQGHSPWWLLEAE